MKPDCRRGQPKRKGTLGPLTAKLQAQLEALRQLPDDQIDFSDIPEVRDWSDAKRGLFYRPRKQQITLRIDADVLAWFRARAGAEGRYQSDINRALRDHVRQNARKAG